MTAIATDSEPLVAATGALQEALSARYELDPRCAGAPVVVALGVTDVITSVEAAPLARSADGCFATPSTPLAPGPASTITLVEAAPLARSAEVRRTASVHLAADAVLVGPFGASAATACGYCLATRWQRLRPGPVRDALETGGQALAVGLWPVLTDFAVDAVWQLYRAAQSVTSTSPGIAQVFRLDLSTMRVQTVELIADPLCPACASAAPAPAMQPAPQLTPRPKPSPHTYRLRNPASYDLPRRALANPVCGVLGPGTGLDLTSPTTAAFSGNFMERGRLGLNDVGWSGKADSFAASGELAFLEGLERYAGTRPRGNARVVVDSLDNLGDAALDPRECGEYAPEAYLRDPVLRPFSPAARIPWVWGHSLRDDRPILVPARSAYYAAATPADDFVFECSNGCATGSCLEEATLFGLLELVERDAFLLGWYGGAPMTEIEPGSVPSQTVRGLTDRAALHGYDVHLFDNRVDLSIPVITCLAVRKDGGDGLLSFAAGSSLDPVKAAEAALGEALTYLPHLAREVRSRRQHIEAMAADFGKVVELRDHALLFARPAAARHARRYLEPAAVRPFGEIFAPPQSTGDLLDDLRNCRRELVDAGCDVIVVDQTTQEQARLGLRTVRAIAPGLLPIDFGWRRQRALQMPRLRTAFVRAGLRSTPLTDRDLHRVPHPFP